MKHKFKIGDIVRHKSARKQEAKQMVVVGVGQITDEHGSYNMYLCSGQKNSYAPHDEMFFRVFLMESELDFYENVI